MNKPSKKKSDIYYEHKVCMILEISPDSFGMTKRILKY